jgi:hypothetical protein
MDGCEEVVDAEIVEPSGSQPTGQQPGHMLSIVHGANSKRVLNTVPQQLVDALIGTYPWLLDTDEVAIYQYCRAEHVCQVLYAAIEQTMGADESKVLLVPEYLWSAVARAEANAMRSADRLGLSPEGRLKIAKDAGFASHFSNQKIGKLMEQGAALRAAGR